MINYDSWKSNILEAIRSLSNIAYQQKVWLGKDNSKVSSFDEDIMMLYDDNGFGDDFWDKQQIANFNFTDLQILELKQFKEHLDKFLLIHNNKRPKPIDKEIIDDPAWIEITRRAKKVLETLLE